MEIQFFDRAGVPIPAYKIILESEVADVKVVTVWSGHDHSDDFSDHAPMIFLTGVFEDGDYNKMLEEYMWATEADAKAGHERIVAVRG